VATYSTGVTVTYDATALGEVVDLAWNIGGQIEGRSFSTPAYTSEPGTVTVQALSTAGVSITKFGKRADLVIAGGGVALTVKAYLSGVGAAAEVNGLTRYAVEFTILDG
jgi:hypothetical protein